MTTETLCSGQAQAAAAKWQGEFQTLLQTTTEDNERGQASLQAIQNEMSSVLGERENLQRACQTETECLAAVTTASHTITTLEHRCNVQEEQAEVAKVAAEETIKELTEPPPNTGDYHARQQPSYGHLSRSGTWEERWGWTPSSTQAGWEEVVRCERVRLCW